MIYKKVNGFLLPNNMKIFYKSEKNQKICIMYWISNWNERPSWFWSYFSWIYKTTYTISAYHHTNVVNSNSAAHLSLGFYEQFCIETIVVFNFLLHKMEVNGYISNYVLSKTSLTNSLHISVWGLWFWCLTRLSTIFQLCCCLK
jgi:hypothetical protein